MKIERAALAITSACVLVLVAVGLFHRTLDYPFISYDLDKHITSDPAIRDLSGQGIVRMFSGPAASGSYYPMRVLSFAIDWAIWRDNPRGYHLSNLLIHAINVLLVFGLILRLGRFVTTDAERGPPASSERWYATIVAGLAGGLLFTVHPLVVQPVTWQGAREELLMTMFALSCLHVHHAARLRYPSPPERPTARWGMIVGLHALAGLLALAAGMSSALGAAVPLLVLAYELAIPTKIRWRRLVAGSAHLWLISLAIVLTKVSTHQEVLARYSPAVEPTQRPALILQTYARNLAHFVWPADLILIYPKDVPQSWFEPGVLAGLGLVAATLAAIWLLRRRRLALFGLLMTLGAMAPSSQVMPNQHFQADRFLYLPLAGLGVLAAAGLLRLSLRRIRFAAGLASSGVIIMALMVTSHRQLAHWKDDLTLMTHCAEIFPYFEYYRDRGIAHVREGQIEQALADFDRAIELEPEQHDTLVNRANVLYQLRRFEGAIADCTRAIEHDPQMVQAYAKRAHCYVTIGQYGRAREDCLAVLRIDPDSPSGDNARLILDWLESEGHSK